MCNLIFRKSIDKHKETNKTILIDWVLTQPLERIFRDNNVGLYIINVYTPIEILVDNMIKRRYENDSRGLFVFSQFSDRYKKCDDTSPYRTQIIKISEFIDKLKANLCFEFENEDDLIKFAEKHYIKMGFTKEESDDETFLYITLRDPVRIMTVGKLSYIEFNEYVKEYLCHLSYEDPYKLDKFGDTHIYWKITI